MGFFGFKKTSLNVGEKKIVVDSSSMTPSASLKNPFKDLFSEKNKSRKDKKLVIVGLCFNGEFRPKILIDWEKIQTGQGSSTVRYYIKKALKIIDEMLRQKINQWVGCLNKDLFDESGKVGIGFLEQMFTVQEGEGGDGRIYWKLKNKNENIARLVQNYKSYCRNLKEWETICKINPEFINEDIKNEVRNSIEKNLKEAIERTVNRWLNAGIWKNNSLCDFLDGFKFENYDCLKTGKIGTDLFLRQDIKNLIPRLKESENMNIEIGWWWLSGQGKNKNQEWGRDRGKSDNRGVIEKLIEFSGSVGQLKDQTLKQAVKELIEEFEKGIIKQKEVFCGVWNEGVSCPDGGVVLYKK